MPLYVSTSYKLLTLYLGSAFQRTGSAPAATSLRFTLAKGWSALKSSRVNCPGYGVATMQDRLRPTTADMSRRGWSLPMKIKPRGPFEQTI